MIDFHAARIAAAVSGAPGFATEGLRGTYYVSPDGWETPDAYIIADGAAEFLRDGDEDYCPMDKPRTIVLKATGEVVYLDALASVGIFRNALEVHDPDPTPLP